MRGWKRGPIVRTVQVDLCCVLVGGLLLLASPQDSGQAQDAAVAGPQRPDAPGSVAAPRGAAAGASDGVPRSVTVVVGERRDTLRTTASTVRELLADEGIALGTADLVTPAPAARLRDGMTVAVGRVRTQRQTTTVTLPHGTREVVSDRLPTSRRLHAAGVDGELLRVFAVTTVNGVEVSRRLESERVTRAPEAEVVQVAGAAGKSGVASSSGGASGWPRTYLAQDAGVWDRLAQCESGQNWSINTGNGYYGGLQFDVATWRAFGGAGYPHEHSKTEQIAVAERLRAVRGLAPWPACGRKLGLP